MVIPPGGDGNGSRSDSSHWRVHKETAGNHIVKYGLSPHICIMCWDRADSGDEPDDEMVVIGRGKLA